jgi:putative oxidoreductase
MIAGANAGGRMRIADVARLDPLARGTDAALLVTRVCVGAFLVWGVWDNITDPEDMQKFAAFLKQFGFPWPQVMAPFDVAVQFLCGLLVFAGLLTRWAGLLCALNFAIAIAMVDRHAGIRASFPALSLILIGLLLATCGPGKLSLDALLFRRGSRLGRR